MNAIENACLRLGMIWRDLLQEDVGVDGSIELVLDGAPTGKLVGVQVKSGSSYIRASNGETFRFYPTLDDLEYWRKLVIPLVLVVFDPSSSSLYWIDITREVEDRLGGASGSPFFTLSHSRALDEEFHAYLMGLFDLNMSGEDEFETLRTELAQLSFTDVSADGMAVTITGLELFVESLWGLCTKTCFHFSMMTDLLREKLSGDGVPRTINFNLSREGLFPFFSEYFKLLGSGHIARLDYGDISVSMYSRLEWPTYVVPLTTNGRAFVRYLRKVSEQPDNVRDHQFFNLRVHPHLRIEVFDSYTLGEQEPFGELVELISIHMNRSLDYYHVVHLSYGAQEGLRATILSQTMFFFELRDYLARILGGVDPNRVVGRYQDSGVSPLSCWLESFLQITQPVPPEFLAQTPPSKHYGVLEEWLNVISGWSVVSVMETPIPDLGALYASNGKPIFPVPPEPTSE